MPAISPMSRMKFIIGNIQIGLISYYEALKTAQLSNGVTGWIAWFVDMVIAAQTDAEQQRGAGGI